ncbi:MAG: hypothetical protein ABR609_08715 [Acidimicrobiia bacterium]
MNRQGVVTVAGSPPPLRVRLDGDGADITALHLSSYIPTVGDRVILGRWGSQWVVLGKVEA